MRAKPSTQILPAPPRTVAHYAIALAIMGAAFSPVANAQLDRSAGSYSLRTLIDDATIIAMVHVQAVEGVPTAPDGAAPPQSQPTPDNNEPLPIRAGRAPQPTATLTVQEVFKGAVRPGDELRVPFWLPAPCSAPPRFTCGETILVFLAPSKVDPNRLQVCGGADGVRQLPDLAARDTLTRRVRERLEMRQAAESPARRMATLGWLVDCAVDPATRRDGAFDLNNAFRRYGPLATGDRFTARPDDLSLVQRARLVRALLDAERDAPGAAELREVVAAAVNCDAIASRLRRLRDTNIREPATRAGARELISTIAADLGMPDEFALADRLGAADVKQQNMGSPLSSKEVGELRAALHAFRVDAEQRLRALRRALGERD